MAGGALSKLLSSGEDDNLVVGIFIGNVAKVARTSQLVKALPARRLLFTDDHAFMHDTAATWQHTFMFGVGVCVHACVARA